MTKSKLFLRNFVRIAAIGLATQFLLCFAAAGQTTAEDQKQQLQSQMQRIRQTENETIEELKRGVVRVTAQRTAAVEDDGDTGKADEFGTGIVLSFSSRSALILTALHVVDGATAIHINFYSDQMKAYPVRKLPKHSSALDLAVLQVDFSPAFPMPAGLPTYNFAANDTLQATERLSSVNGDWTIVGNTITRLNYEGDPQKFEYTNASVGKGFSGGPIFNDYGNVIGIHLARTKDGSYAIADKIGSALEVLEAIGYAVPKAGGVVLPNYASAGAAVPPRTRAPGTGGGGGSAIQTGSGPCDNGGCTGTLASLRHIATYQNAGRGGCIEGVYAFPKGWPGDNLFLHATYCSGLGGAMAQAVRMRMAASGGQGDGDMMLGTATLTGSTGSGFMTDSKGVRWKLAVKNPNFGGVMNLNAISISVQPF